LHRFIQNFIYHNYRISLPIFHLLAHWIYMQWRPSFNRFVTVPASFIQHFFNTNLAALRWTLSMGSMLRHAAILALYSKSEKWWLWASYIHLWAGSSPTENNDLASTMDSQFNTRKLLPMKNYYWSFRCCAVTEQNKTWCKCISKTFGKCRETQSFQTPTIYGF
jgi:hypothetical protein